MAIQWCASWLWDADSSAPDTWMCFRKTFMTDAAISEAKAFISCDSRYWLWINGQMVVFEGGLNRGPEPGSGYYDEVSIEKYIVKGVNTIAVLVWYWGNGGRNSVDSGAGGLLFQSEIAGNLLISDKTWRVKVHPGYFKTGAPYPSGLYAGHNIGFDARNDDIQGWNTAGYDDSEWEHASEKGRPPEKPWGNIFHRPIPMIKDYGIKNYTELVSRDNVYYAKLPYAAHITPVFRIYSKKPGLTIDIRTDRYQINGGPGDTQNKYNSHRTEFLTREGIQEFESPDWLFGEEVIYSMPEDVQVLELKYRETGYDTDLAGEFVCSDELLNTLYEKSRRTLYVCMRDNYMDCPDRERGQWIGDVSSQIPQTFYTLSRSTDKLTKKAISDFITWRSGDILRGNVPGAHCGELPSQSLNAVSEIGMIMAYYIHSGDKEVLNSSYEAIKNYLNLWSFDNNLLKPRSGDWYWFDHGKNIDSAVLEYAWYFSALKAALKISELTGNDSDAGDFQNRINIINNSFDELFWDGKGYRSGSFYDDRANAMAVLSGIAENDKWPFVKDILINVKNATPYMEGYILDAMFKMSCGKEAVHRMKERYQPLADNENTTLWEDFSELGTRNHAWSGGPLTILAKYIAGIEPVSPGYETYKVMPGLELADLSSLHIKVPTVKGDISVTVSKSPEKYKLSISSPAGCTATVGIPVNVSHDKRVSKVLSGRHLLWDKHKNVSDIKGITYLECNGKYIVFNIEPGNWELTGL